MQKYQVVVLNEEKERFFVHKADARNYLLLKTKKGCDCLFYELINGAWIYSQ